MADIRDAFDQFQASIGAWGEATFPTSTPLTVLSHFGEEANEFIDAHLAMFGVFGVPRTFPTAAAEEAADCFLLLLHYAHKQGFSLYDAAARKMEINRTRTWNTDPEPGGHIKHKEG